MSKTLLAYLLLLTLMTTTSFAETRQERKPPLAFRFSHVDDVNPDTAKLPFFRVFPGGKDKNEKDASSTLNTLKFARGESKLYKAEDAKPGLILILRRLVLVPLANGDYKAILEGEFNSVECKIKKETMDKLFRGEKIDLVIESDTTKGVRPVAFNIKATTTFRAALKNDDLLFYSIEGKSKITHYGLTGTFVYESEPVAIGPERNGEPLYIGRAMKPVMKSDGKPETLPIIN